jgi:hypothetical protein
VTLTAQAIRTARRLQAARRGRRRSRCDVHGGPSWEYIAEQRVQQHLAANLRAVSALVHFTRPLCDARVLLQTGASICRYTGRASCDGSSHPSH